MNKLIKLLFGIGITTVLLSACGTENTPANDDNNNHDDTTQVEEPTPHLGANFNARLGPHFVRFSELESSKTTWIRGMLDFFTSTKSTRMEKNGSVIRRF